MTSSVKKLSGEQVRQIRDALLSAFPSRESLAMMVRLGLDERLDDHISGSNLSEVTFNLIEWAESQGKVPELLESAVKQNPENPALKSLIQNAHHWGSFKQDDSKSAPESKEESKDARYLSFKPRIIGLPYVRILWPLQLPDGQIPPRDDANFDFPVALDDIDIKGVEFSYRINKPIDKMANVYSVCEEYLSTSSHHIIFGTRYAGKSWLRSYLEYYLLGTSTTGDEPLITFYFAPATLAFRHNQNDVIISMARSIANQMFANLLLKSSQPKADRSLALQQCAALAPFFQQYSYITPTNGLSLAYPAPKDSILDLDLAYGNSSLRDLYMDMKQEVVRTVTPSNSLWQISKESLDPPIGQNTISYSKLWPIIRSVLASLYVDESSIRRICSDSGIDLSRIRFDSSVQNIWYSVLIEADKSKRVDDLFTAIKDEYGANKELGNVYDAYQRLKTQANPSEFSISERTGISSAYNQRNDDRSYTEQVLDDIHRAVEVAHYSKVFLLVDNWDRVAAGSRKRLLTDLLAPELLKQTLERKLYMKVFMPEVDPVSLKPFHRECEVQRTDSKPIPPFSIYSYHEPKAEA